MTWPMLSALLAATGALVAGVGFFVKETLDLSHATALISERVARLEADNRVFWSVVEPHMAQVIHQDTARERDELVDRFVGRQGLTPEELEHIQTLLREVANDERRDPGERMAASLLIAKARIELDHIKPRDTNVALRPKKRWWRR